MKKSNGGKYVLIRRTGAAPKADTTIGMYKRDGKGAYTTSEEDEVPMTPTQKASDEAEKRRAEASKKREKIQQARQDLQKSNQEKRQKLQQAKTAEELEVDEGNRVVDQAIKNARNRTVMHNKQNPKHPSSWAYQEKKRLDRKIGAGSADVRTALKTGQPKTAAGQEWLKKYKASRAGQLQTNSFDIANEGNRAIDATIKQGEKNVAAAKEAKRKADHSKMVAKLIAARGTKPKKGPYKPHPKSTVVTQKYHQSHDELRKAARYDTLTGKRNEEMDIDENLAYLKGTKGRTFVVAKRKTKGMRGKQDPVSMSVVDRSGKTVKDYGSHVSVDGAKKFGTSRGFTEGTNARERGEVQSPRSQDEYDALSPENKKLVDARAERARRQSMSANPGESPHNRKKRKPRNRNRNQVQSEGRPWGREVGAEWDEPDGPDYSSRRRKAPRKPPPAPPKDYEKKHPLSQKDRAAIRNKLGRKKYPQSDQSEEAPKHWKPEVGSPEHYRRLYKSGQDQFKTGPEVGSKAHYRKLYKVKPGQFKTKVSKGGPSPISGKPGYSEEVTWEEAQYWSEDTVAAFLKRGGKITKLKPRVARGATKKKTIRLRGSTKSTADRGRKAEKKVHGEEVEEIAGRYEEKEKHWTEREREDTETDRRLAGITRKDEREAQKKARAASAQQRKQEREKKKNNEETIIDEGGMGGKFPKDKPLRSPTAKAAAKRLSKKRADLRKKLRGSEGKEYAISRTTGKPGAKPRLVRGGGKSDTQKTLDKIEREDESVDWSPKAIEEAKMKVILKRVIRGASPFTIVALKNGRAIAQEHAKISQAVPAFVREMKKKHPNARISVEDRTGRVLHTEEHIDEARRPTGWERSASKKAAKDYKKLMARHTRTRVFDIPFAEFREIETSANKVMGVRPGGLLTPGSLVRDLDKFATNESVNVDEAVAVDGRTRDYKGTRTRLEAKGRRKGEGLDGRTKGYRDARTRITARQEKAAAAAAAMDQQVEPENTTEIEEMQSGSKHSVIEPDTSSSFLNRRTGSKRRGGPTSVGRKSKSSKKDKEEVSRKTRRGRKQKGVRESRVSLTPDEEEKVRKKARADIEKDQAERKAIRDKTTKVDHWGIRRSKGKPNPADELTRDFNKESIDKEELKRLMHKKDLDNRHRRREDKAAQRTAKTKRSFGPKGKKPAGTMQVAFRKALVKKRG